MSVPESGGVSNAADDGNPTLPTSNDTTPAPLPTPDDTTPAPVEPIIIEPLIVAAPGDDEVPVPLEVADDDIDDVGLAPALVDAAIDDAVPATHGITSSSPADDFDDLDRRVDEHLGQIQGGWNAPQRALWVEGFITLLATYPYLGPVPTNLIREYLQRLRGVLRNQEYPVEAVGIYLTQFRNAYRAMIINDAGAGGANVAPTYRAEPGPVACGIWRIIGAHEVHLANFVALIEEQVCVVGEASTSERWTVRVVINGCERRFVITGDDYNADRLKAAFRSATGGHSEIYCPLDDLRNAIANITRTAGLPVSRTLTMNFGWNDAFDVYRVPSGRITAEGFQVAHEDDPVRVDLSGEQHASRLDLRPLDPAELARVKRHICTDLLLIHEQRVMLIMLATVALAVLHPKARGVGKFALWLVGLTGSGKTFIARLIQNFFGSWSHHESLVSCSATANYIEQQGHYFRHAIYILDDYRPNMIAPGQMIRLLQAYADSTSRSRLRSDSTAAAAKPIRGILVVTGEDTVEHTASALARTIVVEVANRPKDIARGMRCVAESIHYSGVTADFIRWLLAADSLERFAARVEELKVLYGRGVEGSQNDVRIAGNFAQLGAAGELVLQYLSDVLPGAREIAREFVEVDLLAMRGGAIHDTQDEQASEVFLKVLADLISMGAVRVAGDPPGVPEPVEARPLVGIFRPSRLPSRSDPGCPSYFELSMRTCLENVNVALTRTGGNTLGVTEKALLQQLRHGGHLLDANGRPLANAGDACRVVRLSGQAMRCFRISRTRLLDGEQEAAPGPEGS